MNNVFLAVIISDPLYYILCAVLSAAVLLGIYFMSKVEKSVFGNAISALALGLGIILTFIKFDLLPVWVLYPSLGIGTIIGLFLAVKVKMIQMPQLVALLNGLGGLASAIVGSLALFNLTSSNAFSNATALFAIVIGMITFTGSLIAAMKLHKMISQKPVVLPKHPMITGILLVLIVILLVLGSIEQLHFMLIAVFGLLIISSLFGIVFTIRVGGADMPITISLLNSFSGVAGAIAGLAINDLYLVSVGAIVGASGLLLTKVMCKAMNRKLLDILLGKTTLAGKPIKIEVEEETLQSHSSPIPVMQTAKQVIIVPGYGMALAQAQHLVKKLADQFQSQGASVKYAIHPVAGRMPGHMNVLLAEAGVDYDDLYEMDQINSEFATSDLVIVVGANDVLNPAARQAVGTPIYGMPILNVDQAKQVIICNLDTKPGYAGVDNPLYKRKEGVYLLLGDAAENIQNLLQNWMQEIK